MFLLIVVIVLALLVGCRQQCLPPRLPFRVRALLSSSPRACCSPPLCPRPWFFRPRTSLAKKTLPEGRLPLGCLFASINIWLVGWVFSLPMWLVFYRPPEQEEQLNIVMHRIWSYRVGVCFPQSPYQIQYKHQRPNSL